MIRIANEQKSIICMTDLAAATIMSSNKALFSWDLKILKLGEAVFIDKRTDPNILDLQTINETSTDNPIPDEAGLNGIRELMKETTKVTNAWMTGCRDEKVVQKLDEPDPFIEAEGQTTAKFGYIYKLWNIGGGIKICVRCKIHSYLHGGPYDQLSEEEKADPAN